MRKKVVSNLRHCQAKATDYDPIQHPDDFGQRGFHCPEDLAQGQRGQPEAGWGGGLGQEGIEEKGRVFSEGRNRLGAARVDRIQARWKD